MRQTESLLSGDLYSVAHRIIDKLPVKRRSRQSHIQVPNVDGTQQLAAWKDASQRLEALWHQHEDERHTLIGIWASDAATACGDLHRALSIHPRGSLLAKRSTSASNILSLKLAIDSPPTGADILALCGPKLTPYGRGHIDQVSEFLTVRLDAIRNLEGRNVLAEWAESEPTRQGDYGLFRGYAPTPCSPPRSILFELIHNAEREAVELMRDAENTIREEHGIPRVGEGWVAETQLYYHIKRAFPEVDVVQHGRPVWLGRQHLDVFLPELRIGIEYQGVQHDRPIAYFGGQAAFEANQKRDRIKKAKCARHGVKVIYVRAGYDLAAVVKEIVAASR